ncbi:MULTISPECIES: dihydrolipoyl dehydrogenase [Pseudoalteromonas]|uniref:dihydrolipoyl dehydrogenase n=1 Tax=Pseudoalteromonas TaxID=53246 RepID=UPI002352D56C|nr:MULTISPECIES: dihydrolipoyl dehydrogenase [Pseudoalteromonas]MDN3404598.1 dihydrolipoyl dehydrogenase [Pseudoalteromonas sp. APC 3218]MDN3408394.1 dihydrolipoyl dehydrogenase [Pseudoalteromonas sp. APC 3894]MDN3415071.1 dihydrolipoyl dehydrogenase [Pseudoalteromonas sp. APC 3227]MDN3418769.1 dihydrolipoyl dehydrogenase [Pseudoalteromonas sp. APC 3895]MDN3423101.1 dihydrolipoyl dehydrogenase [Pseudoalteromonas sp. APC 3896]|tara:strand:- start:1104 stop:2552 length:1449 start_codon:yes stop_codon:yes gene_type:complete
MKELQTDVVVIGAGTAGLSAYRNAKQFTQNVLMIESGPYGTTCARVGCMPSKLLIAAAEAAHSIEMAPAFGVHSSKPVIDGKAVMARVKSERDRFAGFVVEAVDEIPSEDKIRGYAQFLDANRVQIDDHTIITAKRFVIATGSRPSYPGVFNNFGDRLIINDDVFDWDDLPESVAVFGPGVIGLEIGQALHRLGVKVKLFGVGGAIGPLTDPVVKDYANTVFAEEFYVDTDSNVSDMKKVGNKAELTYTDKQGVKHTEQFDYVLAATGRVPNTDKLGLENTGIDLDERGVPTADAHTMQCGDSHIFIAGDASNMIPLLHEASDQGTIAGQNAGRYPQVRAGLRRAKIAAVFSDPQIAMVGESFKEISERLGSCDCFEIGEVSFENQGRSRVMLKNKGHMRVYAEHGTGLFLGAEFIGPQAEHIAHLLAWAVQNKMTVPQILDMPFYHPVIEEGLRTALRDLNAKLKFGPDILNHCMECGPGA